MAVTFSNTNKPLNPRGNDASPLAYNRAALYSGKALSFDGVNDYVSVADSDNLDGFTDFTYSVIVKADSTPNYCRLFDKGLDTILGAFNLSDQLYLYINSQNIQFDYVLKLNEYLHFSIVFTGGQDVKLYVNGVLEETKTHSIASTGTNSTNLAIGSINTLNGNVWDGHMSNARLFNTALTPAQIADLYNNPEKIVPTGVDNTALKLWLPMMESAGTTAYDGSGNGNHGTISGATYVNGVGAPVSQTSVIDWNKSSNYIDKSEEFETTSWSENRLITITDDSFIAPDGSATATEIIENTANDSHFLAQTLSVTAGDYFISVYAKKKDYDFIQLSTGGDVSRYANFNISTGATGNANGITDLIIEDAGNGWYRIGGKLTTGATAFNYFVTLIQSDVASRFQTYTGTDKGQYIWGAQATKSATLQPYLRNIGTSAITTPVLLPAGLTTGRDITGVNLFENVRKQGALNLDGSSWAEVHDNESLDVTTGVSLETWIYWDDSIDKGILGKWHTGSNKRVHLLYKWASNRFRFYLSNNGSTQQYQANLTAISEGWNHIVGTFDGTNLITYLNGSTDGSSAATFSLLDTNDKKTEIGRYGETISYSYPNAIAQPRIYNRALTASEVLRNYNSGKNTYTNS